MRKCDKIFLAIFVFEITLTVYLILSNLPSKDAAVLGSMLTAIVTTGLVYHSFRQEPEFRFKNFLVEPYKSSNLDLRTPIFLLIPVRVMIDNSELIAKEEYIEVVANRKQVKHVFLKKPSWLDRIIGAWVKVVETNEPPDFLRIANDIMNIGFCEVKVHECRMEITYPNELAEKSKKLVKPKRKKLVPQERLTVNVRFPFEFFEKSEFRDLKSLVKRWGNLYRIKFTVISATMQSSREIWINISDDLKTVKWSECRFRRLIKWDIQTSR